MFVCRISDAAIPAVCVCSPGSVSDSSHHFLPLHHGPIETEAAAHHHRSPRSSNGDLNTALFIFIITYNVCTHTQMYVKLPINKPISILPLLLLLFFPFFNEALVYFFLRREALLRLVSPFHRSPTC